MRTLIIVAIMMLAWSPSARAGARIALVVGNSRYVHAPALKNAANDARLIDARLRAAGFTTILLIDGDRVRLERAVGDFAGRLRAANGDAVALFFYAGHGVQVDQRNYVVPIDAAVVDRSRAKLENISADTIVDMVAEADARMGLFFFDACRNDPYPAEARGLRRVGLARDLGHKRPPGGVLIAYATAPDSVAADGDDGDSPFSKALADALVEPGMMVEQVMKRVRMKVRAETRGAQESWDNSSLVENFVFVSGPVTLNIADSGLAPQREWWERIRASTQPSDFDEFLRVFHEGPYVELASTRRQSLAARMAALSSASGGEGPLRLAARDGGAQVVDLRPGTPLYGELFAGDIIRKVDDDDVADLADLPAALSERIARNGHVALRVQRGGLNLMLTVPPR